jgi:predicted signal transduction protein with EAL and GGDEF domain
MTPKSAAMRVSSIPQISQFRRRTDNGFPPIIDADSEWTIGFDALARWASPVRSDRRDLGIGCIIDGVETKEEMAALGALGGLTVQRYFYSRPIESDKLAGFLEQRAIDAPKRLVELNVWPARRQANQPRVLAICK